MQVNRRFLLAQDPDRLLHTFRLTAGIPSTAEPLGGWEAPVNELRGHYTGHYLSAWRCMSASQGDAELKARGDQLVAELAACQRALGNGYLSAFPEELFDRLRDGKPVWAPFYTLHKIMAGLLDMHTLAGNPQALEVLQGMARWVARWTQPLGDAAMARVLEREYGGMNELLYNLSAPDEPGLAPGPGAPLRPRALLRTAGAGPGRAEGTARQHQHPQGRSAPRGATSSPASRATAASPSTSGARSRPSGRTAPAARATARGGTREPGRARRPSCRGYTQEDCVTYNMLKLTRHVFGWTADPACADYYERALFNGILGSQHPRDGKKLYYVIAGLGPVEALRHAVPGLLVLHRHDERGVRASSATASTSTTTRACA